MLKPLGECSDVFRRSTAAAADQPGALAKPAFCFIDELLGRQRRSPNWSGGVGHLRVDTDRSLPAFANHRDSRRHRCYFGVHHVDDVRTHGNQCVQNVFKVYVCVIEPDQSVVRFREVAR